MEEGLFRMISLLNDVVIAPLLPLPMVGYMY